MGGVMAVSDAGGDVQASFDALTIGLTRLVGMMRVMHSDPAEEWTDDQINAFGVLMNDCVADTVEAWGKLAADLHAVELMRAALQQAGPAARVMQ